MTGKIIIRGWTDKTERNPGTRNGYFVFFVLDRKEYDVLDTKALTKQEAFKIARKLVKEKCDVVIVEDDKDSYFIYRAYYRLTEKFPFREPIYK